jgi:hypothetical protein
MMEHIRMFVSDLRQVGSFLRFPPQRYNCNIAENGVKDQHFLKIVHNLWLADQFISRNHLTSIAIIWKIQHSYTVSIIL